MLLLSGASLRLYDVVKLRQVSLPVSLACSQLLDDAIKRGRAAAPAVARMHSLSSLCCASFEWTGPTGTPTLRHAWT